MQKLKKENGFNMKLPTELKKYIGTMNGFGYAVVEGPNLIWHPPGQDLNYCRYIAGILNGAYQLGYADRFVEEINELLKIVGN